MRKGLLIKYIAGEANEIERKQVLDWVDKSSNHKEYFIILKNTWISQNMPGGKASEQELEHLRESVERLEADILRVGRVRGRTDDSLEAGNPLGINKIIRKRATGRMLKITTAISTVAAVVAVGVLITRSSVSSMEQKYKEGLIAVAMQDYPQEFKRVIYTEKGVKSFIVLPDSSKVWLNSDTKITFPEKFLGATREVELEGEAYFSVVSDSLQPMIVSTQKGFKVKVMGTEFNLRSYKNESKAVASLYQGKIDLLYTASGKTELIRRIRPNEQVVIAESLVKIAAPKTIADNCAWKEGRLIFDSAKMEDVIKDLERWHGVEIIVKDPKILSYTISATFNAESIVQIMDMIKYCILIDYKIESNKVYIFNR